MIFNTEQKKAVEHENGPALVLAGPGSGKTAVITGRTIRLVRECKISPWRVLVITFTKAAAEEMKQRYMQAADPREYGVCFGTFHAVFFRILREDGGLSGRSLIKSAESCDIASEAFKKACGERHFTNEDIKQILSEISRRKSGGLTGKRAVPCTDEEFDLIFKEYDSVLRSSGKLDFDDILVRCRELLLKKPKVLDRWRRAFDYILVDEYQDINRVQYDVLRLLAAPKNNIFAVGDDDQSIYAFRGACPELTKNFLNDFPGAVRIVLNTNYRSGRSITRAALSMIGHNKSRFEKRISPASKENGSTEVLCFEDRHEEYTALAEMLRGEELRDIAVLFRTNRQPRVLAAVLEGRGIAFSAKESFSDIYSHHVTQDMLAYARIAAGSLERADFLRICNKPERYIKREWFGMGQVDLKAIEERLETRGDSLGNLPEVCGMIKGLDPLGVIKFLRHGAGYDEYLKFYADRNGCSETELFETLEELTETAGTVKNVAEWEKMLRGGEERLKTPDLRENAVHLMTFHSSKGLEFRKVFITDMNEDVVPIKTAVTDEALEEERRAAYVAMTRAKERLVLMYVKKRGGRYVQPSRFLKETGI